VFGRFALRGIETSQDRFTNRSPIHSRFGDLPAHGNWQAEQAVSIKANSN
jgi:hypothetical protein